MRRNRPLYWKVHRYYQWQPLDNLTTRSLLKTKVVRRQSHLTTVIVVGRRCLRGLSRCLTHFSHADFLLSLDLDHAHKVKKADNLVGRVDFVPADSAEV